MKVLVFRLYAPLASWGDVAVGEFRPSNGYPGRSAILGLIGAALGVARDDQVRHDQLDDALSIAVAVYSEGSLLRDYHTVQVPGSSDLKGRPHATRADELLVPRQQLKTILSSRDYRQDALCVAGAWLRSPSHGVELEAISEALRKPRFALYLGRKSCPPALPLLPQVVEAENFRAALSEAQFPELDGLDSITIPEQPQRVAWAEDIDVGWQQSFSVPRKDLPLSRQRWQFGDRIERVALIGAASALNEREDD